MDEACEREGQKHTRGRSNVIIEDRRELKLVAKIVDVADEDKSKIIWGSGGRRCRAEQYDQIHKALKCPFRHHVWHSNRRRYQQSWQQKRDSGDCGRNARGCVIILELREAV